jgi:hypothetical protein
MIRALLPRDDLGSFFSKPNAAALERTLAAAPNKNQVVLEFPDDGASFAGLPHRIIVPDDELEQFYAWMATYFDILSPVTSFIDVVPVSEDTKETKMAISEERLRILVAITAIEAAVQIRKSKARQAPGIFAASLRCASWVYAQSLSRGRQSEDVAVAIERWARVRTTLTGVDTPFSFEHVMSFWNELLPIFGVSVKGQMHDSLMRLNTVAVEKGTVDLEYWANLAPLLKSSSNVEAVLRGPRQERIEVFTEATRSLPNDDRDREIYSAFCGYLGSRVSDGGLELWSAVLERSSRFPTMPLWFSFYCAARNNQDLMSFERGVPLRLMKELENKAFDIDAREFLLLGRGRGINASDIHVSSPGSLRVRLAPQIIGEFLAREPAPQAQTQNEERAQPTVQQRNEVQLKTVLSEARMLSDRMTATLARIQQSLDTYNSGQQDLGLKGLAEGATDKPTGTKKRGKS